MERAEEIFERITKQGMIAINGFIEDRKSEELFLDFKRSQNHGTSRKLEENDRKNLAKAISGFGNSEGGVIVWGVDCSTDSDGADVAKALYPIKNPKKFASLLQGVISGCTIPPHSGVKIEAIEMSENEGFVITLIPKSNSAPHQSVISKQYHIRAGSDFVPTPHDVLAGMFGKRPQPHVFHNFLIANAKSQGDRLDISIGLMVYNEGPGIATDVFTICNKNSLPGHNCEMLIDVPDKKVWTGQYNNLFGQISLISEIGFRLPHGVATQPLILIFRLKPPFEGKLNISIKVGCGESRRYDDEINTNATLIEQIYQRCLDKNDISDKTEFISEIFKKPEQC
jgi:hypothetical protein